MGNYLCLRKLEDPLVYHQMGPEASALKKWAQISESGSQSDLPFFVSAQQWQKVQAEPRRCSYRRCPHFRDCFFFEARKELEEADLLIVNHHLLLLDLQNEEQKILPPYKHLIVDEAHHFEQVALHVLAKKLSSSDLLKTLSKIQSEITPEMGPLSLLQKKVEEPSSLRLKLSIDLPAAHMQLGEAIPRVFSSLPHEERFSKESKEGSLWQNLERDFEGLREKLKNMSEGLISLKNDTDDPSLQSLLFELESCGKELAEAARFLQEFFHGEFEPKSVRWTQSARSAPTLAQASLDISTYLQEKLFTQLKSALLCSATLTVQESFSYVQKLLGFTQEKLITRIYPSPFDYQSRTLLLGSPAFVEPSDPRFLEEVSESIVEAVRASDGGAFLLFTSYEQLTICFEKTHDALRKSGLFPLKQGEVGRFALLQNFKAQKKAVLFGTDSFWEGVDVPGEALRCIVIVKLPFKVPTEPLTIARGELLKSEGKDPFLRTLCLKR